jgi:hypothetical protein
MIPNAKIDAGDPSSGPMILPGTYTIRLSVNGQSETTSLRVLPDPRVNMSETDYRTQEDFLLKVRDELTHLTRTVKRLQSIRAQLNSRNELLKQNDQAQALIKESESLITKLTALEEQIHNPKAEVPYDILAFEGGAKLYSRMSGVYSYAMDGDGLPTRGLKDLFADMQKELSGYDAQLKQLIETDLGALNASAKSLDVPTVYVP